MSTQVITQTEMDHPLSRPITPPPSELTPEECFDARMHEMDRAEQEVAAAKQGLLDESSRRPWRTI